MNDDELAVHVAQALEQDHQLATRVEPDATQQIARRENRLDRSSLTVGVLVIESAPEGQDGLRERGDLLSGKATRNFGWPPKADRHDEGIKR